MRRTLLTLAVLAIVATAALLVVVWRPAIPLEGAQPAFQQTEIVQGAQLAAIGNCITCHTKPEGTPFAGGRPIETPFGTIHATNITPDPQTGIGGWSEAAFRRAMKDGVSRDGHHLYPAFPYDHMTKMADGDIRAVYAFMMTRRPVAAETPPNDLPFPFNIRAMVAGWKLLFLDRGVVQADASKGADWNRGAYLVEGLGHCGACHTPRNALGAEKRDQNYGGGESDGWIAPALNAASPAAVPWEADRLHNYLLRGFDDRHGVAAGPMAPVVNNLQAVPDTDVRAISVYVADIAGTATPQKQAEAGLVLARVNDPAHGATSDRPGADIYAGACAQCHGELGRAPAIPALNLALSSTLRMPRPDNVVRIVREGIHPEDGARGPIMPGFAPALTDEQLVSLMNFLRAHFAQRPAWNDVQGSIRRAKETPTREARSAR